jgi:hypothetical protein
MYLAVPTARTGKSGAPDGTEEEEPVPPVVPLKAKKK